MQCNRNQTILLPAKLTDVDSCSSCMHSNTHIHVHTNMHTQHSPLSRCSPADNGSDRRRCCCLRPSAKNSNHGSGHPSKTFKLRSNLQLQTNLNTAYQYVICKPSQLPGWLTSNQTGCETMFVTHATVPVSCPI